MAVSRPQRLQRPSARVMALPISIRWQLKQEAELLQLTAETQCRGCRGRGHSGHTHGLAGGRRELDCVVDGSLEGRRQVRVGQHHGAGLVLAAGPGQVCPNISCSITPSPSPSSPLALAWLRGRAVSHADLYLLLLARGRLLPRTSAFVGLRRTLNFRVNIKFLFALLSSLQ